MPRYNREPKAEIITNTTATIPAATTQYFQNTGTGDATLTWGTEAITLKSGAAFPISARNSGELIVACVVTATTTTVQALYGDFIIDGLGNIGSGGSSSSSSASVVADYKSPADFTVAFASSTTIQITLSTLPFTITDSSQIVYIKVVPSSGSSEIYVNGSNSVTIKVDGAGLITISGVTTPFVTGDVYEVGINRLPRTIGTIPPADFKSPSDFTATFASATTLTLAALPITIGNNAALVYVKVVPSSGTAKLYVNGLQGVTLTVSSTTLTIAGAGTTPFVTGDVYEVGINGQKKGYDLSADADKVLIQNPIWAKVTDPTSLIASGSEQTITNSWVDLPAVEIPCQGYTLMVLYVVLDINSSTNVRIRALGKKASAGANEYTLMIETIGTTDIKVDAEYIEFNTDADQSAILKIYTDGLPYVQLQVQSSNNSDGQIDLLDYHLIWGAGGGK